MTYQPYNDPNQPQHQQPPGPYPPQQPQQPYPQQGYPPISAAPVSPQYAPPGSPMPYQPQQVVVVQGPPTSGLAVTSLVLGILGLVSSCCSFGIFSLGAIIAGHVALGETKNGQKSGHGMAVAGLVMGYVFFIPAVVFSIWIIFGAGMAALDPSTTTP